MEKEIRDRVILTRGGVYLAKLNPAKLAEVGKVRPVVILNSQEILDSLPPVVFVCPLSSKSQESFSYIHLRIAPRDNLEVESFALVERSRAVSSRRIVYPRIAQITEQETQKLLVILKHLLGFVD